MSEDESRNGTPRNLSIVLDGAFTLAIISGLIWLGQVVQRVETLEQRIVRVEAADDRANAASAAQSVQLATINAQYAEIIRRLNKYEDR